MNIGLLDRFAHGYLKMEGKWFDLKWQYINACILESYLKLYAVSGETEYLTFVEDYIERLFDNGDKPSGLDLNQYNIDQIKMAKVVFDLHKIVPKQKYESTVLKAFKQLESYPRTGEGNFWHKEYYPNQVWLDGLYMGHPFYTDCNKAFRTEAGFSDTIGQFLVCRKRLFDESLKLYKHGYDETREMSWADKETGLSPSVWLRAIGWLVMALVDVMEIIGDDEKGVSILKGLFCETMEGLMPYRHDSGLWYQIPDQGARKNNYLETSGSAMISYGLLKGFRLGLCPKSEGLEGVKTLEGLVQTYLREEDGEILLGGICRSAGLGRHPDRGHMRDGTFEYYTTVERICENNGHGVAPLFMAYAEYLLLKRKELI